MKNFMKSVKKFYKNNRIYCILMIISAVCLFIILLTIMIYFISQTKTSIYGNRLDDIESYNVTSDLNDLKGFFESNDKVKGASTDVRGKIIYVVVNFNSDISNEEIQGICTESLTKLSDNNKLFYDVQFVIKREGLNPYLGSKSASKTIISWANYSFEEETTEAIIDDDEGE